ncbi:MAG: RDD family protein [Mycobacterium sp.]
MARSISSWLSGPEAADPRQASGYPGEALGLAQAGPRSLAGSGRRFVALLVDWLIGYGLAGLALSFGWISLSMLSTAVLVVWFVIGAVSVRLFGFTPGQYALGLLVVPVDRSAAGVGFGRAVSRGLLLALVIPALFTDADGRGLQDRFTFTAVVRR